jgi:hypothetical protein
MWEDLLWFVVLQKNEKWQKLDNIADLRGSSILVWGVLGVLYRWMSF